MLKPGETFSIWRLVGRPTKRKGYLEGLVLHNGKVLKGTGGGLCQLGNLLYWMALHTPLSITERWRHSFDVFPDINRTIPFGCGATLAYNYIDLQLQNNTDNDFQISLWIDNEYLNGEITCNADIKTRYEIYETDHLFCHQWWGGYTRHNKIWKKATNLIDNTSTDELVTENHAIMMYNPMLEEKSCSEESEMRNRIKNAVILLKDGHIFKVGDLIFSAGKSDYFSVTGYTLWSLENLTRQKALTELCEIKNIFKNMLTISPELADFVKDKKSVYYLVQDYGNGSLEICREENEEVKWTEILKE